MANYNKDIRTSIDILDSFKNSSRKTQYIKLLASYYNDFITLFDEYDNLGKINDLGNIRHISLTTQEQEDCRNLFESRKQTIKKGIIKNQGNSIFKKKYCWYCNMKGVGTLDHFLPKKDNSPYPELAFYPNNLLLCCDKCNTKKKGAYKDLNNNMYYLNPYYFDNSTIPFLIIKMSLNNNKLKYEYDIDTSKINDSKLKTAIEYQYKKSTLDLLTRFKDEVEELITNLQYDYNDNNISTPNSFYNILKNKTTRLENERGVNNYEVVLYKAILNNSAIFNYIIN